MFISMKIRTSTYKMIHISPKYIISRRLWLTLCWDFTIWFTTTPMRKHIYTCIYVKHCLYNHYTCNYVKAHMHIKCYPKMSEIWIVHETRLYYGLLSLLFLSTMPTLNSSGSFKFPETCMHTPIPKRTLLITHSQICYYCICSCMHMHETSSMRVNIFINIIN